MARGSTATSEDVDTRWQRDGDGRHYATGRWRNRRARERDPRLVARLLDSIQGGPSHETALDVPCGTGRLREGLEARGLRWIGADISPSMLGEAGGPIARASAAELPLTDDAVDLAVCCRLIHHYEDAAHRRAVLAELARVARHHVLVSYWDAASLTAWRRRTRGPLRRRKGKGLRHAVAWKTLEAELRAAGLRPLRRAFSMRWISAQTFVLAEVEDAR